MTLFIATLATETNTFSPLPTGHAGFHTSDYHRNDGSLHPPGIGNIALIEWRRMATDAGIPVAESICSFAQPAGITLRHVYEDLRDTLLDDLKAAMPVSIVLLSMHGAMVADGYDDCEGDTLARVRDIVGPDCTVGIELDLHCHLTETMRENADLIVTFKEYPHTDGAERARELFDLARRTANREITPVIAYHECRMINMWRTPVEPMRSFVARMKALEGQDGILSVSFGHGFPWGDVEEVGAKVVVIADTDQAKAAALAQTLAAEIWAMRAQTTIRHDTIDEAIDAAAASSGTGPVVLADVSDNAGGGAPSDNTEILRRFLDRGVTGAVIGCFWDPVAVQICQEAGEGATFDLRIGGKAGIASGNPVDLRITVRKLSDTHWQTGLGGGRAEFGPSAWVHGAGIDLILVTRRQQPFNPNAFTNMGLDLADKRIVVVKSIQHFYTAFAPLAREVRYVAAPGAIPPDFEKIPYTKRTLPYWPRVDDPFEGING